MEARRIFDATCLRVARPSSTCRSPGTSTECHVTFDRRRAATRAPGGDALPARRAIHPWRLRPRAFRRLSTKTKQGKAKDQSGGETELSRSSLLSLDSRRNSSSRLVTTTEDPHISSLEVRPQVCPIATPRPASISSPLTLPEEAEPVHTPWDPNPAGGSTSLDNLMGTKKAGKMKPVSHRSLSLHKDRGSEIDSLLLAKMTPIILEFKGHPQDSASETAPSIQKNQRSVVASAICDELVRQGMDRNVSENIVSELPHLVDNLISEANRSDWANYSGGIPLIECLSSRVPDLLAQSGYAKIILFLHNLGLSSHLIRRALSEKEIRFSDIIAKVQLLQSIGVQTKHISKIISLHPPFFSHTVENFHSIFRFLMSMCVRGVDLGKVIEIYPEILNPNVQANIPSTVAYFSSLGMSQKEIFRISRLYPKIFGCNLTSNVHPKVVWLQSLGFSSSEISKMVWRCPGLLGCSLEKNLKPSVDFLSNRFSESSLRKIIMSHPAILTLSMGGHVKSALDYFQYELEMNEEEITKMITRQSSILCSSLASLKIKVHYLTSLGLSMPSVIAIITKFPSVLQYGTNTLHPKYEYLVNDMERSVEEVVKFPQYFGYNLESRIVKRHEMWKESGVEKKISLVSMLATSENVFLERIHRLKDSG